MKIEKFVTGIISTNCYILSNEDTKEAVIVDPANLSRKMVSYMEEEQLKPKAILLTHAHFDHIMGIDSILENWNKRSWYTAGGEFGPDKIIRYFREVEARD